MKNSDEFRAAAERLLGLVDAQERGEISELALLREWKAFMRSCHAYFRELDSQIKLN